MRIGDVIYDNDTVLIASASFNKEEPCKECFFYDGHECQSNRYIECWDKSINKDLIMIPFENNKVQDSKMMDHSSKTVTSKTGKDLLSALSRLSSITGDETNDMADTASRTLFSSLSMLDINKKFLSLGIWTDERSTHDEEYFSIEDHNSAIVLPKGTIRRLTGRDLKWEDDPISLKSKSVIDKFPHADIEFYKQKIINFVEWI